MDVRTSTNRRIQLLCAWSGLLILIGFGVGFAALCQFIPIPQANDNAQEVAELYSDNTDGIRAGLAMMMVAGACFASFSAVISMQLKRIEGRAGPLTYTQLAAGAANVVVFTIGVMVMLAASFRPERDPDVTQGLHDLAWLMFVMYVSPLWIQTISIGVAILSGDQTVYPRWVGYFNLWIALGQMPALLVPFFKTGPFAWHGIFEIWLAFLLTFSWLIVMTTMTIRAINQETEGESSPALGNMGVIAGHPRKVAR